jgi:DNA polymerase III subunit epsilon
VDHVLDEEFRASTFVVIDFEGTTPAGHPPEPIEVAAIALRATAGGWTETGRFTALINPPVHARLAAFDTAQTGITVPMLARQPPAPVVLALLEAWHADHRSHLLVAHHAPTEAGILYRYRDSCPTLATTDLLDTLRLARAVYPALTSHRLDAVAAHLRLAVPAGRHRALPDVELTAAVFGRLLIDGAAARLWRSLRQVTQVGRYPARAAQPQQPTLFG